MADPEGEAGFAFLRSLQLWYRARRRQRKIVGRLLEADAIIVTHTKSGRTWLLAMISHLFHQRYGTPASQIVKFDNLHSLDPRVPKIYFTRYAHILSQTDLGAPARLDPRTRLLFLFRDPRDVAVSYHFHLTHRSTAVERAHKGIPDDALAGSMYDFVMDPRVGLLRIIELMNGWVAAMAVAEHGLRLRYEDLRAAPAAELDRVMKFLDQPFELKEIQEAVDFADFANLKQKEAGGFFATDRLRPTDGADPDAFKVRRGKVGGYRDYFDADQVAAIDRLVAERLAPELGYGPTGNSGTPALV